MKPFRATYQQLNYRGEPKGDQMEVLVIKIVPSKIKEVDSEAVFVLPDGRLAQDEISRLSNCRIPWPEG